MSEENLLKVGQCVPLTVPIVPLKPRNFRENGRPEILEIPEISVSVSVFRESDCYNKYQKYRNCSAIPKFPELPEITQKLQREMEIPVKTPEIPVKVCKLRVPYKQHLFT